MVIANNATLEEQDPEIFNLIEAEKNRQWKCLELIASENFTSRAVMDCLGSCLTNKYAEGLPNARYYGGNEVIDKIEILCQQRALTAYGLDADKWGVNVQPYSGSPANFAVYTALLRPHDRIMGLDLPSGGRCDQAQGLTTIGRAGNSRFDWAERSVGRPFEYCDIVTTTTHKSLRGPRAGMIFFRRDERKFEPRINNAVFPALQGDRPKRQIAGIAAQLKEAQTPEFKAYVQQLKANAKVLAKTLTDLGYSMCTGGTDNHLILWDLRPQGVTGSKLEKLCDMVCITLNKNPVPVDSSALTPRVVRV
ncbi:Serine hydroxymethyltransferase, partial [Phytophthora palmivora]